ncbi:carboxypeptidase regulatory-like domain-containing protein [Halococcus sp. PRR34]|uniref:carboxypeptidase regulatory-like domain-containing protein n=2 Tax=Halobacteriales TaxID=2235 RepID=UPI00235E6BE0|nr:carboxypeptidase regulatory-like domain-containing protein [Halococcus sp. PRR34]
MVIAFAFGLVISAGAPVLGTATAGTHADQPSVDTETLAASDSGESTADESGTATLDPALKASNGTVRALLVLDQASVDTDASRAAAIQTLKQKADSIQPSVMASAKRLQGVEVVNRFWVANIVSVKVDTDRAAVNKLATIDGVKTVVKDRTLSIPNSTKGSQSQPANDLSGDMGAQAQTQADGYNTTYGLDQINATDVWDDYGTMGGESKVAVIDTGVDVGHPDIDLYSEDPSNETYPGGWAEFDENGNQVPGSEPHDTAEHGTHTSGTVSGGDASGEYIGVAPNVKLMHGLVIPGGSGSTTQVIAGVQWAVGEGADVTSLSVGAGCGLFGGEVYSQAWIPVIENAKASGTAFVNSAGNGGDCVGSPGNDFHSFSIGASNVDGGIADFSSGDLVEKSNWDDPPADWPDTYIKPNVSGPGVDVKSSVPGGEYGQLSGTSMAAPHVAGAVALLHSVNPDASVSEIQQALNKTAWRPANPTDADHERDTRYGPKDSRYGMGIIDVYNASSMLGGAAPEYTLGDVDESGNLTVQDIKLTQQFIYGDDPETFSEDLADMNRDGEVTTDDLRLLQKKVLDILDEGAIEISNLDAPDTVNDTEAVNVTADLENTGDEGAIQEIALYASNNSSVGDGEPVATETVDMAPEGVDDPVGEPHQTTVSFEVAASEIGSAGDYTIEVASENDSATDELTILGSNFEVSDLSGPEEVDQGDSFDVNATVTNTGNQIDTQTVEFQFRGMTQRTTNVTLDAGESTELTFEDIDTAGVSGGGYQYGVATDDDSETATLTVNEGVFDVNISEAPDELAPGETYNVTAQVENTGNATDQQSVEYELEPAVTNVAVVDSDEGYGDETAAALRNATTDRYNVTVVQDQSVMDHLDAYDTFVMQDLDPADLDVQAFVNATSDEDTGVVWLEQWSSNSDAISELSEATDNPASTGSGFDFDQQPVQYYITNSSPILDGVGEPGDTVPIHTDDDADRSWFSGYGGETIANVGIQNSSDGAALAVESDTSTVLASSLGREQYTENPAFTDAANTILANSVAYASGNDPVGDVSADAGTQDDTSENVTLDPGDSTSVEFTNTVPDDVDISQDWLHVVTSEDDEAEQPVDIDIARGAITGTVTDESGAPIAGATVTANASDGNYTATTGDDGTYTIEDVPTGTHDITASADNYSSATQTVDVPANGTATADFTLAPENGSISGTVTASDAGDPVANVTVAAEDGDGTVYNATTDDNGTYTIDVPPGTYSVNVADTPAGYEAQTIITVGPGEAVTGIDFTVEPTNPPTGSIEGTITNGAGTPIEGAHVVDADGDAFNVSTDEAGHYEIGNLTESTYALRAKTDDYGTSDIRFVDVKANETTTQNFTLGSFFEASNLSAPANADQGETINVSATVTNNGNQQATRTVFYLPPGTDFGSDMRSLDSNLFKEVTLDGGESTTVTFTYTVEANRTPGEHQHGVSADNVVSTTITVESSEPQPAYFALSNVTGPSEAAPGEEFTAEVTVTNTGDEQATQTIYPFLEDSTRMTTYDIGEFGTEQMLNLFHPAAAPQPVTLAGGESQTLTFTYSVADDASGEYQYSVSSLQEIATHPLSVNASNTTQRALVSPDISSVSITAADQIIAGGVGLTE